MPGREGSPSFSPDGAQVAFHWNGPGDDRTNYDIYVQVVGAVEPLQVTEDPARDRFSAWSPDGSLVAFVRDRGELGDRGAVYVISPLGGSERKITSIQPPIQPNERLSWTPDSKFLVFRDRAPDSLGNVLYRISLSSGEREQLTVLPDDMRGNYFAGDLHPVVSPDGRGLAFLRAKTWFQPAVGTIFVARADGSEPRAIAENLTLIRGLDWTADSREILYATVSGLHRLAVTGGAPEIVAGVAGSVLRPTVSGDRLAWVEARSDLNTWRLDLDEDGKPAGEPQPAAASTKLDAASQVSADGRRIVFVSNRSGAAEIWVSDVDGGNPIRLTTMGEEGGYAATPRWSPDGRHVVFNGEREGEPPRDIWVVDVAGGPPRNLTQTKDLYEARPSYSGDGRWVYYRLNRGGEDGARDGEIWKVPVEGGEPVLVTVDGGIDPFESHDGQFVYFSRIGGQGMWAVAATGGDPELLFKVDVPYLWTLGPSGIWIAALRPEGTTLELWEFSTKSFRTVGRLPDETQGEVSVSVDERVLVYVQMDSAGQDLYYAEGFR